MAPREFEPQKETVERVMHEFKHGEFRSGTSGEKVAELRAGACDRPQRGRRVQPADSEGEPSPNLSGRESDESFCFGRWTIASRIRSRWRSAS